MTQPEDKSRDGGPQHARGRHGDSSAELVGARGRDARSVFSPNELVAGRFKIVRFIGQGGMGDVYEAEDLELRERVALKTVRPEIAADEPAIARFKREIQLARRVTHPNVCRIFDVEYHRTTAPEGAIAFLTMELLPGDTPLSTAVKRLKEAPASPRTHVPDLDPKWESAILRCLERDPADRFVSATDVVKVLGGEEVAPGKQALEEQKRRLTK